MTMHAFEPGEPKRGDEVPWHCPGMDPSRVARVQRDGRRWTRVMVQWQSGCESVPAYDGQPADPWTCPVGSEWLTRTEFEDAQRRWLVQTSANDFGGDIDQHEGGAMNNGYNEELVKNLQLRAARVAITASASRKQGAPGVVEKAREFVGALDLGNFVMSTEQGFIHKLDDETKRLKSRLPVGARSWGLARKFLNIFRRDCTYTCILREAHRLDRIEPWLEVPLDSYTVRGLTAEAPKLNERSPGGAR